MKSIEIPIKCISYNTYYRIFRGRYCISTAGREFRDEMLVHINEKLSDNEPTGDKFKMVIECYFTKNYRRDVDNLLKSVLDCITQSKKIYLDDSQVHELTVKKFNNQPNEKVVISWEIME